MKIKDFEVGITSLGNPDTIAAAVQKGNQELLDFINKDIEKLGKENFFHKAYEKTLHPTYGDAAKADDLVVEGGKLTKIQKIIKNQVILVTT